MHVAATNPLALTSDDLDPELVNKEKEIIVEQLKNEKKPAEIIEKITEGKINKFYKQNCLLQQVYVKDPDKTAQDRVTEAVAKLGENIQIRKFSCFVLGEK